MPLFNPSLANTLGGAIGLQGVPKEYSDIAQENIRYNRAEEARKRAEQDKKDKEAADKYADLMGKLKIEGVDKIYEEPLRLKAAAVIGRMNELYKNNKYGDVTADPEWQKTFQDFVFFQNDAKRTSDTVLNPSYDEARKSPDEIEVDPLIAEALNSGDFKKYAEVTGGGFPRSITKRKEKPFDYLTFKKVVKNSFDPYTEITDVIDPTTGNKITTTNILYEKPIESTKLALASDPNADVFYTQQYNNIQDSEKKRLTDKALKEGGSGSAYLEYVAENLFPDKKYAKTTSRPPDSFGTKKTYEAIPGDGEILPKPLSLENIPEGEKLLQKVEWFIPFDKNRKAKIKDPDGNIYEVDNIRKVYYEDGTEGYEAKTLIDSRVKRKVKNKFNKIVETEELLPAFSQVVIPYETNKQIEGGEVGLKEQDDFVKSQLNKNKEPKMGVKKESIKELTWAEKQKLNKNKK